MGHRLGLATRTQISVCKLPFPFAGTAVSLFRAKTVQQRPLLTREVVTRHTRHTNLICQICMKKLVLNVYSDPMHLVLQPDLRENLQDVNLTCCLFEE